MTVTVVGVDGTSLAPGGRHLIGKATLIIGEPRHVEAFAPRGVPHRDLEPLGSSVGAIYREHGKEDGNVVVLVHGDPGFFGMLGALRENGIEPRVLPALSPVQRLAAMAGVPWDDMAIVDGSDGGLRRALNVCRARKAVAVLTAQGAGPTELGAGLDGWRRSLVVAEEIGTPRETLSTVDAAEAAKRLWRFPNVVFSFAESQLGQGKNWNGCGEPCPPDGGWALESEAFAHREGELAADAVRALALARLAPRPGQLVWDIGAGAGQIAVECARLGAAVVAVEPDPGQSVRVLANASRHDVDVRLVGEPAPGSLQELPEPDAVYVGGAGQEVFAAVVASGADRIVTSVADLTKLGAYRDMLRDKGYRVSGRQLAVAGLAEFDGGGVGMGPASQDVLLWGVR
ncbi:bifunctional cobalt-precorrin-7 (C(5))-methyltransferase/cobalt-precorrin-6B (C(15))-methyltransferase [Sciscionella marina]|uniref:bifunctional cobalt-precorrin-7 (C(5))-methyltransferase/cobalt-precorrin-6B (C(15))-methyltransferase n=1 Tax=Sciscionella marina TaxID=508770 RepID=UPI00037EC446|nr:bifunctional cobalt-precorrin-7 (C(5))-methyltransferase CbiE/decarboxylating cobalt-precorrin-6B (C(15))-methyltransferase CbiT [Sciscionella marina]